MAHTRTHFANGARAERGTQNIGDAMSSRLTPSDATSAAVSLDESRKLCRKLRRRRKSSFAGTLAPPTRRPSGAVQAPHVRRPPPSAASCVLWSPSEWRRERSVWPTTTFSSAAAAAARKQETLLPSSYFNNLARSSARRHLRATPKEAISQVERSNTLARQHQGCDLLCGFWELLGA